MKSKKFWLYAVLGGSSFLGFLVLGYFHLVKLGFTINDISGELWNAVLFAAVCAYAGLCILIIFMYFMSRERYEFLYHKNKELKSIIECSDNLIFYFSLKTKKYSWYGDANKIFGVDEKDCNFVQLSHPDDLPLLLQQFEDTKRGLTYYVETKLKDSNGSYRQCSCYMVLVKNTLGKAKNILGIVRNMEN